MTILAALWLPIVLSAVFVFILSAIIHMVLKYHASDFAKLPNEDAVRAAFKGTNPEARAYVIPHCKDMKEMQTPEMQKKYTEGPIAVLYLRRPAVPSMGPYLLQWFLLCLAISVFLGYIAGTAIPPGVQYMHVFRVVGTAGFLAYGVGQMAASVWMAKPWSLAAKEAFDGLLYGLVTAGTFGWLWPK